VAGGGVMMRRVAFACVLGLAFMASGAAQSSQAQRPPDPAREKRLEWFRDVKYGMFIHWGLYAIPAGEYKGQRAPGIGEWIMNRLRIPVTEYEQLTKQFNPTKFNPDEWVQLAQDAGMKYMVITSKHHDGFALFKSAVSPYNVADATPYKKDIIKMLADACAKRGMRLGFYYSQSQDWHEKDGAGNTWDFGPDTDAGGKELKNYDAYLRGKAEPQVKELLTNYGPVALIWFDTPRMMQGERGQRFVDIVRSTQPNTLIDGRLGTEGDYRSTGDNVIPSEASSEAWETPATINDTWGFRKDDTNWKSAGQITFKLVDIVSKGGNYLLNVGPTSEGVIPQPSADVLRTVGRWLKVNGEAVYGAGVSPWGDEYGEWTTKNGKDVRGQKLFLANNEWRATTKPGKVYITFFAEPRVPFEIPPMRNKLLRAYQLEDKKPVELTAKDGKTTFSLARPMWDSMATVVVLEFEGDKIVR
jgi:alpha-L-fucosidase